MILKLKRTPGIYLVGFMGCGKTTIGRMLADALGWSFVDLDETIEAEQGTTISEIFETRGEPEFRRLETAAIRKSVTLVEAGRPTVVALGGGAFAESGNFEMLENNGISLWLHCSLEMIRKRVAGHTHRPLARDPQRLEELYGARLASYARADFRIAIESDDPAVAVARILKLPIF